MAVFFFAVGLITLVLGAVMVALSIIAGAGVVYTLAGLSTAGSSLGFFAVYAVIDRLDKLVEATSDRRTLDRRDPKAP